MKKIISLFQRNYDSDRLVRDEVVPGAETCNGADDNCNGSIDEASGGGPLTRTCYSGASGLYCEQGSGAANSQAGAAAGGPAQVAGGIIGFVVCAIAALVAYNRYAAGRVPQLDGIAASVDRGVVATIDASVTLGREVVRRARSISGGSAGGSAPSSPAKAGALVGSSGSSSGYGAF